jgi:ADP-heptose:LPS heptosyltransferase
VHRFIEYPVGTRNAWELARVWWEIRRFRPDVLIYLAASRGEGRVERDRRFFRACGIRNIVGLPTGDLGEYLYDPLTGVWEQESARLLRCMAPLGRIDGDDLRNWDLRLSPAELARAEEALAETQGRPLIACAPGCKMPANEWGLENWRELMDRLAGEFPEHWLVLAGAQQDAEFGAEIARSWKGRVVNLCGRLTPRESAAMLARVELFLGPDSGPKHLASSQGVPCALVFSARNRPGIWFPPGRGHRVVLHRVECENCGLEICIEKRKKCILSITADEMHQAAMEAWKNGREARSGQLSRG